jgi:hypothetical protein
MKKEKQEQENYFALRLGLRHYPPLIEHRPPLIGVLEDSKNLKKSKSISLKRLAPTPTKRT